MEDITFRQSSPQGAQRFKKPWLLCIAALVLVLFYTTGALIFTSLKLTAKDSCMVKFDLLPPKWHMTSRKPFCVNMTSDGMLKILHSGMYLIYGQVTPVAEEYITYHVPFIVQIVKQKDIVLQTAKDENDDFQILTLVGVHELKAGDTIYLKFNSNDHVEKNKTYWGISLMPDLSFTS
ncbi:tumor necrosis factor ligand superfamily member 18 [Psammomys obesus]|uniref:tumor necrosis factor ligand superfamily member 18 n=1 Tax=Psammomys obesus TaxID=48139 RepID=UPI0024531699|nr:tumor necrosis factor ligand superfamily member 18 [Psammomys obesus]